MFQAASIKKDPNWIPPAPTVTPPLSADYCILSKESLVELLQRCNKCPSGKCSLKFTEEAHALSCDTKCTSCGAEYSWSNTTVLTTANASPWEKLKKINVDLVVGSTVTAVGTSVSDPNYQQITNR